MFVGENDFFILSTMRECDGTINFDKDAVIETLTDCVEEIDSVIRSEITHRFSDDELKDVAIPTKEEIYSSLFSDKYLCYIIGEGSSEYKLVFHTTKFSVGNSVEQLEMSFCQR